MVSYVLISNMVEITLPILVPMPLHGAVAALPTLVVAVAGLNPGSH
jgi:hypothetical protein